MWKEGDAFRMRKGRVPAHIDTMAESMGSLSLSQGGSDAKRSDRQPVEQGAKRTRLEERAENAEELGLKTQGDHLLARRAQAERAASSSQTWVRSDGLRLSRSGR